MRGVYDAATPRGYSVLVCDGGASIEAEQEAYRLLLEKRVDGVLVNSGAGGTGPLRRLAAAEMPFVVLNRRIDDAGIDVDYVMIDAERGAYLATRHLLELGHARIVYHAITPQNVPSLERLPGYRRALAELIMESKRALNDTYQRVTATMQRLKPRPTAIVAYNDQHAVAVLKALHDLGLAVPEDVAVVGQNNLEFTDFLMPPLTSVAHAVQQMGQQGTEILLQKLAWTGDQPWLPHRVALEPVLIVRESSGQAIATAPKPSPRRASRR
jgi:DNA-binding LacI/PurR family transcriptional regulator